MSHVRVLLLLLLFTPTAVAFEEHEASDVWQAQFGAGQAFVSHTPDVVREGEQFQGTLELMSVSNVSEVRYQVCIVADACIISPRPATQVDSDTWMFTTADFVNPLNGKPHTWHEGEWIGVQYFLTFSDREGLFDFPHAWNETDPRCAEPLACEASHYFTFYVAPPASQDAPWPTALILFALLGGALARRKA